MYSYGPEHMNQGCIYTVIGRGLEEFHLTKTLLNFSRFLRHVPLIYVDYPGETSLKQIYGTFNRAMLKRFSSLNPPADSLTNAMVEFFLKVQVSPAFLS